MRCEEEHWETDESPFLRRVRPDGAVDDLRMDMWLTMRRRALEAADFFVWSIGAD